jgi:hypothetical protein
MVMETGCSDQLTFFPIGKQQVTVDFNGAAVVTDTGLLEISRFEKQLGILSGLAARMPDPRAQLFVTHSMQEILSQQVYQILGDYPDCNDAQMLRDDPLFKTLAGLSPGSEQPLSSGSTLARFHYAFTRRDAELPPQERPALLEQHQARWQRIKIINDYLPELFIRTRRQAPSFVIVDLDATDDPTHGQQILTAFHGFYEQYQYFPLMVFDGETGFPLGMHLRPGRAHASWGAVGALQTVVSQLRACYPSVTILVRGDNGLANPEMYEYCEREGLLYAFGYATNEVLRRRTNHVRSELELYYRFYGRGESIQRFESFDDYQAGSWSRPRRVLAKIEINSLGTNRRFVVTNMSGDAQGLYHGFYVKRGNVPEKPINELKNQLSADRLSAHGFTANALRLGLHAISFAIMVLFREAMVEVPELARAEVATIRSRLLKVGATVKTSVRRILFEVSATWPHRSLWMKVRTALDKFLARLKQPAAAVESALTHIVSGAMQARNDVPTAAATTLK